MATSGRVQQLLRHILRHGAAPPPPDGAGSPGGGATPGASPANGEPRRRVSLSTPPGAHEGGASATSAASAMQQKIRIGVCAMDKKAQSKPMREILGRLLRYGEFEMVAFGDEMILDQPVEAWPEVECLLSWYSDGFPLAKAQAYAALRHPFLVNDLQMQDVLQDRRHVYRVLRDNGIPLPTHIIVDRDGLAEGESPPGFVEEEDYVELGGTRIYKPFVEKPASGEDHNIYIYYPHSMGGGVKRLFRKVQNKSSQYDPDHPGTVRKEGSYIYEEFLPTGGTDVKVYTVGPRYAHAEARKSPVVDGKVLRAPDGKEIRFPVLLSPQEKEIARMVCLAFGQKVCGFDLLRSDNGRSYVCDVNGWSFVKNSKKYYDDAAGILRSIILSALAPHRLTSAASDKLPPLSRASLARLGAFPGSFHSVHSEGAPSDGGGVCGGGGGGGGSDGGDSFNSELLPPELSITDLSGVDALEAHATDERSAREELRCVLAVVRHGDRTPKQKLKMRVTQPELLALFHKFADSKGKQAKLKSPLQLQELLDTTRGLLQRLEDPSANQGLSPEESEARDEAREKFRILRTVLEQGGHFSGINRKVQLKPLRWSSAAPNDSMSAAPSQPLSAQSSAGAAAMQAATLIAAASVVGGEGSGGGAAPAGGAAAGAGAQQSQAGKPPAEQPLAADGASPFTNAASAAAAATAAAAASAAAASAAAASALARSSSAAAAAAASLSPRGGGQPAAAGQKPAVEELLLILKWGGVLTHAGRQQAEDLGRTFRLVMYPRYGSVGGGLLRLHSTYRHDLKIYSSDEGRVQMSAAAFIQGLLDLEGSSLTPILVSLVQKDASMLDAFGKGASEDIRAAKSLLYNTMTFDPDAPAEPDVPPRPPLAITPPLPLPSPPRTPGDGGGSSGGGGARGGAGSGAAGNGAAAGGSGRISRTGSGSSSLAARAATATVAAAAASIEQEQRLEAAGGAAAAAPAAPAAAAAAAAERPAPVFDRAAFDAARAVISGMPENPLQHLRRLHELMGALVDQLRSRCMAESARAAGAQGAKRFSSLSQDPREWELDEGRPCSGEKLLLMFDRWAKLHRSFCKKGRFDISKVPDIYDCAKYDAIHNAHLDLVGLASLYAEAKVLADAVIPNEYGIDPAGKLNIGSKICSELLGKLLIDLESMREESMATLGVDGDSDEGPSYGLVGAEQDDSRAGPGGLSGESSGEGGDDYSAEHETTYRLCPNYASDINSPLRHVRTRIYFTSESHMHSLANVVRFAHLGTAAVSTVSAAAAAAAGGAAAGGSSSEGGAGPAGAAANGGGAEAGAAAAAGGGGAPQQMLTEDGMDLLRVTTELDYMTHLVFRLYENKSVPVEDPERFRVEVLFSPGAGYDPTQVTPPKHDHTLPVLPRAQLHPGAGIPLATFSSMLGQFATDPSKVKAAKAGPGGIPLPGPASARPSVDHGARPGTSP